MSKTLLIVIGLLAALLTAAGMMHFRPRRYPAPIKPETGCHGNCTIVNYDPYDTVVTYYIRISSESTDEPVAFTTTYKEMLKHTSRDIRDVAEEALRQLGVSDDEIKQAKTGKVDVKKASELIIAHIFKQTPAMNHPSVQFRFVELPVDDLFQKMGWQIFKNISTVWTDYTYIISKNKVFDFLESLGSSGLDSACVSDIDQDGQYELIFTSSGGSGIHFSGVGLCYKKGDSIEKSGSNLSYLNGPGDLFVWKENDQKVVVEIGKNLWKFGKWERLTALGTVKIENKDGASSCIIEEKKNLPDEFKQYISRPQQPAEKK